MGEGNGNGNGVKQNGDSNGNGVVFDERAPLLGGNERLVDDDSRESVIDQGDDGSRDEEILDNSIRDNGANQQVGNVRAVFISISVFTLVFLQTSNMSGITTTQSKIAEDLDSFAEATWFTSIYLIGLSSMSPIAARLAQIFSPRSCILVAALLFALGGVIASQARDLATFLAGRAISGVGSAGIMSISLILVLELSTKKRRGLFIGLFNSAFTLGVSLGAVVAGALLPVTGWRFLFLVQGPLGVIAGVAIFFSIPKEFTSGQKAIEGSISSKLAKIDYLGALTLVATIVLFLFGLSSPKIEWLPILISMLLLVIFLYIELRLAGDPIIPVRVLKSRGALLLCFSQLGLMSARWTILFYTPVYAIAVRGWSPASAGAILVPTNFGFAVGGIITGLFHIKRSGSFWLPSIVSSFLFFLSLIVFSQISLPSTSVPVYILVALINGLCIGAVINYTLAHMLHLTPPSTHFISSSLVTTFRGFAGSFGSAIGGGAFMRIIRSSLEQGFDDNGGMNKGRRELVRKLLGSPALVGTLTGVEKEVAVNAYVIGLKMLWGGAAVVALIMVGVTAGTGWKKGKEDAGDGDEDRDALLEGAGNRLRNEEWEEGMEDAA